MPEHRGFGDRLDKSKLGLIGARVESLAGLLFVNLDPDAPSLAETTGELASRLERYGLPDLVRFSDGDRPVIEGGRIRLTGAPGLGCELVEDVARKYAKPGEGFFEE